MTLSKLKSRFNKTKLLEARQAESLQTLEPETLQTLVATVEPTACIDSPKVSETKVSPPETLKLCKLCDRDSLWKQVGTETWRCLFCEKPPNRSIVDLVRIGGVERRPHGSGDGQTVNVDGNGSLAAIEPVSSGAADDSRVVLLESYTLNAFAPVCLECRSQIYVERHWSDGKSDMTCWCCESPTDGKPKPQLIGTGRKSKPLATRIENEPSE